MDQFIEVDHYRFRYDAKGRSDHPAILFLHGFLGNCYEFDQVMSLLADQFYCLAVDLPGHGKTQTLDADRGYSMPHTAQGLIQFIEVLNIQPCFLVGYSMGGRVSLYLTLHFPTYFLKVVLESASPGLKTQAEQSKRMQRDLKLAHQLETEDFSSFLAQWYTQPLFASLRSHPNFEQILKQRLDNDPWQLAKSLRHLGTGYQASLWEACQHTTVCTLLLVGELDEKFVQTNAEMARLSRCMTLRIVEQCGHNIHFEKTSVFSQYVQRFLEQDAVQ
ncbi:MAG TPA: 2-succinyl-6-hydroxy-2,4-cyclohexadiene-1-carboxylate synthase [Coleofasciculaceae cyanobacterium]